MWGSIVGMCLDYNIFTRTREGVSFPRTREGVRLDCLLGVQMDCLFVVHLDFLLSAAAAKGCIWVFALSRSRSWLRSAMRVVE